MSNQPEMSREDQIGSKTTMWQVLVQQGKDDRADHLMREIESLQWQHGRSGGYGWLRDEG